MMARDMVEETIEEDYADDAPVMTLQEAQEMIADPDEFSQTFHNRVTGLALDTFLRQHSSNLSAAEHALTSHSAFVLDDAQPPQRILYSRTTLGPTTRLNSTSMQNHLDISPEHVDEESINEGEEGPLTGQDISRLRRLINLRREVLGWCVEDDEEEMMERSAASRYTPSLSHTDNYYTANFRSRQQQTSQSPEFQVMDLDASDEDVYNSEDDEDEYEAEARRFTRSHHLQDQAVGGLSITGSSVFTPAVHENPATGVPFWCLTSSYSSVQAYKVLFYEEIAKLEKELLDANGNEMCEEIGFKPKLNDLEKYRYALSELDGVVPVGR